MTAERGSDRAAVRAVRVVVRGRVQGVGYRWHVREAARRMAVTGWVRNCDDGSVELLVAGDPRAVDAVLEAVRSGPPAARVEDVEVVPAGDSVLPPTFSVR